MTLLILLLCGATMPTNSRRLDPEVVAGCWNKIHQVHSCVFNIIKAFFSYGSINNVGVPWSKVPPSIARDCHVSPTPDAKVDDFKWTSTYLWPTI
ncbi:hypothetical protein LINPERHAP2_LOCUS9610 [Linum perenne]